MSDPVRVLLLEMPKLLRGLLEHAVSAQRDCELWNDTRRELHMLTNPPPPPDIVMLGLTAAQDATLVPALFARWPAAQIVTMMPTGDDAAVYELMPRRRLLGPLSPSEIVETLRDVAHESRKLLQE